MKYISTRGTDYAYTSAQAIKQGLAPDGGLFVPETIPTLSKDDILRMTTQPYVMTAADVLSLFLDDYSYDELRDYCTQAYSPEKFGENPIPLVQLNAYNEREHILELWHGPTAAFKDVALQLLPHLLTAAIRKTGESRKVCILTATSGDTGKAALEGFKDVPGTEVIVFYPSDGVSEAQRLQMITTEGSNVHVIAVEGCFDDAQSGVKRIFSDEEFAATLQEKGVVLSSANSINWGRLVPQIAYYVASYADLIAQEKIVYGYPINIVVPTGNFGNIMACWYAMKMGIPINKLICASNRNKVLSDFLRSGKYDKNREFFKTNSPSMDILVSSNLERLLFEMTGHNGAKVVEWMNQLNMNGTYSVDPMTLRQLQSVFVGGFADEIGILKTIREVYDRCDHVVDTHTAVGFNVYGRYYSRSGDESKTIFVSTASPFKFADSVMDAINGNGYSKGRSSEVIIRELAEESSLEIPVGLANLSEKPVLHDVKIERDDMQKAVGEILGV
ncbi:MAG: threonine synthase [Trichococcus flocculiformis]|uniref:Threonine synthase n=1 Tax=Trichococcus flocculiformis TaxID=82803 RepID=A0A847D323_9LACT|nr:threonine synthase [Trichococcus flocculiformis]NLD30995.1 threonine synthase [Trichococcus flocculiformis]